MPVDLNKLLLLPQKERRKIAEKLFSSLEDNKSVGVLSKDEKILLSKRWEEYLSGKMKFISSVEMKEIVFS